MLKRKLRIVKNVKTSKLLKVPKNRIEITVIYLYLSDPTLLVTFENFHDQPQNKNVKGVAYVPGQIWSELKLFKIYGSKLTHLLK